MRASNAAAVREIKAFTKRGADNSDQMLRSIALTLLTAIVRRSPVDTGRFRGNWAVQVSLAPQTSETDDKAGTATISAAESELGRFKVGDQLFLLNHLGYSIELERGSSKQAPAGMVRITAEEFTQYVARAARGLRV